MKNPHLELQDAIFEIAKTAYETDDFFKEVEAVLEQNVALINKTINRLRYATIAERARMKLNIDILSRQIEQAQQMLREYLDICFAEDGKVEIEEPDQKKLDAAFAKAEVAHQRIYIIYKHTRPHLLEDFAKIAVEGYSPEELEEFFKKIAMREMTELSAILASVQDDGSSLRP